MPGQDGNPRCEVADGPAGIRVVFPADDPMAATARALFRRHAAPAVAAAFAPGEIAFPLVVRFGVRPVLQDTPLPGLRAVDGGNGGVYHPVWPGWTPPGPPLPPGLPDEYGLVEIAARIDIMNQPTNVVHELVHALRYHQGRCLLLRRTRDEVETELETVARCPYRALVALERDAIRARSVQGAYGLLDGDQIGALWDDRVLLTGSEEANLVGPEVAARVRAVYAETALSALGSWRSLVLALRDRLPF